MNVSQCAPISYLPSTAVSQTLHHRVDFRLEHLGEFGTVLVDTRCLAIVQPSIVEHQPDIIYVLPGLLILTCIEFALYCGQVYWILYDVKVVL